MATSTPKTALTNGLSVILVPATPPFLGLVLVGKDVVTVTSLYPKFCIIHELYDPENVETAEVPVVLKVAVPVQVANTLG
jgi:hypothetical protein